MALFGQSFGAFGDRLKGLLGDPEQQTALLSNPMFRMGTGILANPGQGVQGAVRGLAAAKQQGQSDEDRERMEKLREQLSQLIQKQLGGDPDTPTEQALGMSLLPGMAGSGVAGAAAGAAGMPQDIMSLIGGMNPPATGPAAAMGAAAGGAGGGAAGMATNPAISALAQGAGAGNPQAEQAIQNQAREMLAMQGVTQPTQQELEMMLNALRAQAGQ